jgi:glutamine amidotransferase
MIAIVDYRMGNLGSIRNMLRRLGAEAAISGDAGEIEKADRLILPGVGAFDEAMRRLHESGLLPLLRRKVLDGGTPILGICLGMQLLTERSEEGELPGLGWIEGETVRFRFDPKERGLRVPHMGWNSVKPRRADCLFHGADDETGFYFVHSYHAVLRHPEDILAETEHGYEFPSALRRGCIFGTQFHPEKSHRHGMLLLKNFLERS